MLVQYWNSPDPPPEILACADSVRRISRGFDYRLFDRNDAEAWIASRVSMQAARAFAACAVPAMQADYFRYCYLAAEGGIYVDADFLAVADLAPLFSGTPALRLFVREDGLRVPNGLILAKAAGHPALRVALEIATQNIEAKTLESVWWATGPAIFSLLYGIHRYGAAAFLDRIVRSFPELPPEMFEVWDRILTVVGHGDICADVTFSPESHMYEYVTEPAMKYKETDTHWMRWRGSIYATGSR